MRVSFYFLQVQEQTVVAQGVTSDQGDLVTTIVARLRPVILQVNQDYLFTPCNFD
jgi:hypothetical protein